MALSKYEQKTNHMLSPGEGNAVVKCDGKCLICDFNDPNFGCTYPSSKVGYAYPISPDPQLPEEK